MITITGIGDHLRPEWLITITGTRSRAVWDDGVFDAVEIWPSRLPIILVAGELNFPLSLAAWCHVQCDTFSWADDREENRRDGLDLAQRALRVAGDDPSVIAPAAFVVGRFREDIDGAIALIDRSLALNPSFAWGWHVSGWLRLFAGQPDLAIKHFSNSTRLSPRGQRMQTANGNRADNIALARRLLGLLDPPPSSADSDGTENRHEDNQWNACPGCGGRMIIIETFEPGCQPRLWPIPSIGFDSS